MELTFPRISDKVDRVKIIAEWLRQHKIPDASVVKAQRSAMIRIHVPRPDMLKGFDSVHKDELNQCFEIIKELTDFANIVETTNQIALR